MVAIPTNEGRPIRPSFFVFFWGMTPQEVDERIAAAIAAHELRVALASGLFGLLLTAGTWHAIWLCRG
jgi:hypothetical protein